MNEARIDKWMWAVRIFKTRTIAAEACKKGRISINGALAKAARTVKPGDVIQVRKPFVNRAKGIGRPTKKDRRSLEEFTEPEFLDDFDFEFDFEEE